MKIGPRNAVLTQPMTFWMGCLISLHFQCRVNPHPLQTRSTFVLSALRTDEVVPGGEAIPTLYLKIIFSLCIEETERSVEREIIVYRPEEDKGMNLVWPEKRGV